MRLPFPERVPLFPVLTFCLVLALIQQLQGTTVFFSGCTAAFIILTTLAFNVSGGFTMPSGVFIFSFGFIGVIFGIIYKVFVGEAGNSNLLQPDLTIEVYVVTMAALVVVAYLNRRFRRKKGMLPAFASDEDMRRAAIGSFIVGMVPVLLQIIRPNQAGTGVALVLLHLAENFLPLSILLGVTAEIKRTGGRSSMTTLTLIAATVTFLQSIVSFSKGNLFYAFAAWAVPAAAQRYKVNIVQVAGLILALGWISYYLVPYCQYGRNFLVVGESFSDNVKLNILLLENLGTVRKIYLENSSEIFAGVDVPHYYTEPQGLPERVQMVTPDDLIVNLTETSGTFGLTPTLYSIYNIVPHLIWPDKPAANFGTIYAHELGLLADDDESTGISFSPSGDAYHQARWAGILVLLPILMFILFFNVDSVCGNVTESPFGLLVFLGFLHAAPEGGIIQTPTESTTGILFLYVIAYLGARVLPLVASLILGPPKNIGPTQVSTPQTLSPQL